ncbi:MAG: adenylate/guanylate cyclase domain-containing protein [Bacteroidetes bacterium]|jgi:adenylate cyclase|nr:adenylate/guanylate cyclase domain-containing protein [Bacteroidota bacterium]HMU13116.1 adenylate/guanylate cyclase domain-containing protein [Flavobacteriales bacterium]HRT54224.1 adenylate/guanylate cyclase domain-containing protein [Flavobacteriales bacterium]
MPATFSFVERRVWRVLRITLWWLAAGLIFAVWESNTLEDHGHDPERLATMDHQLRRFLLIGFIGANVYIFLLRRHLRRMAYLTASGFMIALVAMILVLATVLDAGNAGGTFADAIRARLISWRFVGEFLLWGILAIATMSLVRLNDQFGTGARSFLLGRYFKPRQELRIFMFLDMRSSTTIAEEIGDTRYFQLLNEVYADITDPVTNHAGDIYQYVGDEISVSWPLRQGVRGQRCLKCFFAIREKLRKRAAHYHQRYGFSPVFKAGLHYGQVTTGEIGLVKRQTIYSGDVVNTVARIQSTCNVHGVDNLVSKDLLDVLLPPAGSWSVRPIGEVPLKGKRNAVMLYTVEPK